jgi:hypothetical protein
MPSLHLLASTVPGLLSSSSTSPSIAVMVSTIMALAQIVISK